MKTASCHPARKMQARGLCKSCYDKWLKENNPKYRKDQISNTTKWARKNPDKIKVILERRAAKYKADPNYRLKQRNRHLKKYGLTQEMYLNLLNQQNGCCALCFRKPDENILHVDHDHVTLRVRGLLCHQCNWYLGTVDADPLILDRIKLYREAK